MMTCAPSLFPQRCSDWLPDHPLELGSSLSLTDNYWISISNLSLELSYPSTLPISHFPFPTIADRSLFEPAFPSSRLSLIIAKSVPSTRIPRRATFGSSGPQLF
jgi:hypothetical protein